MFSFVFNQLQALPKNFKIIINGNEIACAKENAMSISQKIFRYYSSQKNQNSSEAKDNDFFSIAIPEFKNPFICSESDYQYFNNIFNLIQIRLSNSNKDVLKIFANELEIKELSSLVQMYEESYELITNDKVLQIQKEIANEMININNENFENLIEHIINVDKENKDTNDNENNVTNDYENNVTNDNEKNVKNDKENNVKNDNENKDKNDNENNVKSDDENSEKNVTELIINNDFLYSIVLTSCSIRSDKIELLMKLLKELEEKTNRNQFEYFKNMILHEVKENFHYNCNEVKFVIRHLYDIHEIDEKRIVEVLGRKNSTTGEMTILSSYESLLFDKFDDINLSKKKDLFTIRSYDRKKEEECVFNYSKDEIIEYARTGYSPDKIYQAIKNDDVDLFTELVSEKTTNERSFNDYIHTLTFERNSCLFECPKIKYLDFSAFYGSEKVFNYILMNGEKSKIIKERTVVFAFSGGNTSIIHHCSELLESDRELLLKSLMYTIKYNHNEVFEWLIETYNPIETEISLNKYDMYESKFLENAIRFNNFEALFYLLSIGIDYTPLFSLSLLYNNYYLAQLAIRLNYNCDFSSSKIIKKDYCSPFLYKYNDISLFFFLNLNYHFSLPSSRIELILLN